MSSSIWRRLALMLGTLGLSLALVVGPAATGRSQTAPDNSGTQASRLPPAVSQVSFNDQTGTYQADGDSSSDDVALPYSPDVTARLQQLEAQLQQQQAITVSLQRQLQGQAPVPAVAPAPSSTKVKRYVVGTDTIATGKWLADGLTFASPNGDFKTHLGGLAQEDYIAIRNDNPGITNPNGLATTDSVTFRRLRFRAEGTMYETIDWVSEFDFAGFVQNTDQANAAAQNLGLRSFPTGTGVQAGNAINVIQPTTVFMTFKSLPVVGNIRVGSQQDWFGMEHIESARFTDFMERATIMDAYMGPNNNGYTSGISFFNNILNQNVNYMGGVYKNNAYDSGYTFDLGDHNWTYNLRATWTPFYDEPTNGRYLLHLGIGSEYRTFNTATSATQGFDNIRLRSRGDLRTASATLDPNFADTGNFFTQTQTLVDPELAFQWGSFLLQAEWTSSFFNGAYTTQPGTAGSASLGKNAYTNGGYVSMMYFLTGESRVYNRQSGVFGRTIPLQNAFYKRGAGCHGWGAVQVGIRYDWLDLNTSGGAANLNGGQERDLTAAVNWFLNPNARLVFNGVASYIDSAAAATAPGTLGALNGARFSGDGTVLSCGTRMDFNF